MSIDAKLDALESQLKTVISGQIKLNQEQKNITQEQKKLSLEQKNLSLEHKVLSNEHQEFRATQKAMLELINTLHNNQVTGFATVNQRLNQMDKKINKLAKKANVEFGTVNDKLTNIHSEIKKINKVTGYEEQYKNILRIVR